MSQYKWEATINLNGIDVGVTCLTGYDKPLHYCFLVVEFMSDLINTPIFSNLDLDNPAMLPEEVQEISQNLGCPVPSDILSKITAEYDADTNPRIMYYDRTNRNRRGYRV